jgi:hypothetical protein
MAQDLGRRPWRAHAHGRLLAGLQASLHAVPAPGGLPRRFATGDPGRDRGLRLDLHPENVILTRDGPVLIDWSNAAAGGPAAGVALTVAIPRGAGLGPAQDAGLRVFLGGFPRASRTDPVPRAAEAFAARGGPAAETVRAPRRGRQLSRAPARRPPSLARWLTR